MCVYYAILRTLSIYIFMYTIPDLVDCGYDVVVATLAVLSLNTNTHVHPSSYVHIFIIEYMYIYIYIYI